MKLTSVKSKLFIPTLAPGLVTGGIEYVIKEGTSNLNWTGPKIPVAIWEEVLRFFQWTYDTHKAESQVRLFVNPTLETWAAWAFPQEARSAGATLELDNHPQRGPQREQFKSAEGWTLLGTAHHHCSMGAFQSGTDRNNETHQDGLHITVGNMNSKDRYDIHARFYYNQSEFQPDMGAFWEVGAEVRALIPAALHDQVARFQMTTVPAPLQPEELPFPAVWKDNVVTPQALVLKETTHYPPNGNGANGTGIVSGFGSSRGEPFHKRKENALKMVRGLCLHKGVDMLTFDSMMHILQEDDITQAMIDAANRHDVKFGDILREWQWEQDQRAIQAAHVGEMGYGWGD